jgi:hypothetical protein
MEYQQKAPSGLIPIKFPNAKRITHYIDAHDQVWWYCDKTCRIYGMRYAKGYYLKEAIYLIGSLRYTLIELKQFAPPTP